MAADRDDPPISRAESQPDGREGGPASRPFTEDVFDEEYYGRSGRRRSRGTPLGLIVGIVIGAAVAGGVAWYVFRVPVNQGGNAAAPAIVKAEATPYKIKPENPGGMQVENQDKLVYDRLAKADAPPRTENLLPPPEQPKAPPAAPAAKPPASDTPAPKVDKEVQGIVSDMIKNMEAQQAAAKAALPPSTPETVPTAPVEAPKVETPAPTPAPVAAAAPVPVATPAPPAQVATAAPFPEGSFAVQLAAARSEEQAMSEWNRVKNKHEQMFAGMTPSVIRADLGERGVFFRLRAGPLADRAAADAMCVALKAENEACIVVKP